MMKVYCLTCSQMPWRNEAVAARFKEAGLNVEFFHGIHGATVGIAPTLSHFDSPGHLISPGKLSITLSKTLLWQMLLEREDPFALVLENDVSFCSDFKAELAKSLAALPPDWDVAHVGHCCIEDKPTRRINDRVAEVRYPLCCHAVLWTKRAAALALAEFKRASWGTPSDIILARAVYPQLRHYTFVPGLVAQDQTTSEAASTARWDTIQGWFDFAPIYNEWLNGVTGPSTFVEVGAWKGRSTAYLAEQIKCRILPVTLYAVDTWKGMAYGGLADEVTRDFGGDLFPTFQRNMSRAGVLDYVRPIQAPSVEAARQFADGSVDCLFLDGDHTEAAVAADLEAWLPKLKPTGVIAGHDIDVEGVRAAVKKRLPRYRVWERCWLAEPERR